MKLAIILVVCALTCVMAKVKVSMKVPDPQKVPVTGKTPNTEKVPVTEKTPDTEKMPIIQKPEVTSTEKEESNFCTTQPCMWSIQEKKAINITNTVCHCKAGESCQKDEDNTKDKTWVYRCK